MAREAEFCGAMDGAARFSQRDSLATILITAINIVAGFLIGVFQQGVPFQQALKTYTILTVGDGLVVIIPSLLVSVAGGIVVTRAASDHSLGADIGTQMFRTARPLWIVSGCLLSLALIPGDAQNPIHRSRRRHHVCGVEDETSAKPKRQQPRSPPRKRQRRLSSIPWMRR